MCFSFLLGGFLSKHMKSKDMFTPRFRTLLNHGADSDTELEEQNPYLDRLNSLQAILAFTEQDARDLLEGLPDKELEPGQEFI